MTLTIHPDPQEPAGGFAFLQLPAGTLGKGPVMVAVLEIYGGRWLGPFEDAGAKPAVGDGNWQGERHEFGPYGVHVHDGADRVRIGPEIVDRIDEYMPLRLSVGAGVHDVTWPDDVPPRAGAAVLGGLQSTARPILQDSAGALVGKPDAQPPPEDPGQSEPPPQPAPAPETVPAPQKRNLLLPALLVLALIGALLAAWLLIPRDQTPQAGTGTGTDTCTRAALMALDGFAAAEQAIRTCGDAVSAGTVLKIIEDAARRDDPGALLLFGTLYDGSELDTRIETQIGLSFDHDAARAAEYYARAKAAGSEQAGDRLAATCAQLATAQQTLAKGAFDDYCG